MTGSARRGETKLVVDQADRFEIGDEVRLVLQDDDKRSLVHHLYGGDPSNIDNLKGVREEWIAHVVQVDRNLRQIAFDRPLRTDVRQEWEPVLYPARSNRCGRRGEH